MVWTWRPGRLLSAERTESTRDSQQISTNFLSACNGGHQALTKGCSCMKKSLPFKASLVQLRHQAKDLLKEFRAGKQEAITRFSEHHGRATNSDGATLSDAQFVVAREYGFASWPKLKQHLDLMTRVDKRVQKLRAEFAAGDRETKLRLLRTAHSRLRFEDYNPDAASLSEADARLLVANEEGYAFWSKYDSFLHLDPAVQAVISAVRTGDLTKLREILRFDP